MDEMTFEQAIERYATDMGITKKEAKEDAERMIEQQMKLEGVPREFAESTFIEQVEDTDTAELDEMEKKAKANGATKVGAKAVDAFGKKRVRVVKEDEQKLTLIDTLAQALGQVAERVEVVNKQQKVDCWIGGNYYTVTLTKHRPPKK